MTGVTDILIVGGGINGAGIARDAAGRGLSVTLCEMGDLGSATSSASSKLIHGGLRYLEHREFRLVRESLSEREVLLRAAPHIIWPLRFVLPHHAGLRPAWLLRTGLFIYDHLGGRRMLPATRTVRLGPNDPLRDIYRTGFEYSDCWVEDARLVVLNARDAADRCARVRTRARCGEARMVDGVWEARLIRPDGGTETVRARALVNAAGPWVMNVQGAMGALGNRRTVRLVKGSHIVVPRLHDDPRAFTLQNADGRIVFVIPYERRFSLVGTTDVVFTDDPGRAQASPDEIAYLCGVVTAYFRTPVSPADVVWSFAGVRPLLEDGSENPSAVTRDYTLDLETPPDGAPALTVFGGKITTYRRLAEDALAKLLPTLGHDGRPWTAAAPLPGGDIADADFERFAAETARRFPFLPPAMARRMARAYGTRIERIVDGATTLAALGWDFGGVTEAELDHLRRDEWAMTAEDALWRRSKLGLHLDAGVRADIAAWFERALR